MGRMKEKWARERERKDKPSRTCKARCRGSEMYCAECRLTWDLDDPEPPKCGKN